MAAFYPALAQAAGGFEYEGAMAQLDEALDMVTSRPDPSRKKAGLQLVFSAAKLPWAGKGDRKLYFDCVPTDVPNKARRVSRLV